MTVADPKSYHYFSLNLSGQSMTNNDPRERAPTLLLAKSDFQWESPAAGFATSAGFHVVTATTIAEVFQQPMHDHDVCLMVDVKHPEIEWPEFHGLLLEHRIDIPVVAVARRTDTSIVEVAVESGANFVVSDPLDPQWMIATLNSAYSNSRALRYRFSVERSHRLINELNERECSILHLAVNGSPNKQIASKLGLHIKTIERIRQSAYDKLQVRSTAEMTRVMTLGEAYEFTFRSDRANGIRHPHFAMRPSSVA